MDFRNYLKRWVDRYFYNARLLNNSVPFAEFRRRSQIDSNVKASGDRAEFARHIRKNVPGMTIDAEYHNADSSPT